MSTVARGVALATLATVSACLIEPDLVPCGELACPAGTVCTAAGCAWPEQLSACAGKLDGESCTALALTGVCVQEVCRELLCGDAVLVPGEVCDDGNQRAGDGCSADCLSTETCGNGIVDGIASEECDNSVIGLSHDGCSSTCLIELPSWFDVTQTLPTSSGGLAYDVARRRLVSIEFTFNAMWEYDGAAWRRIVPVQMPPRRYGYSLGYDEANERTVMFGGLLDGSSSILNETWTWDGVVWTQETPTTGPAPREDANLAFDSARNELVLFGGHANSTKYRDTWIWTGSSWAARTPTVSPNYTATSGANGFRGTAMAFDATAGKIVLFTDSGRTWLWDGTSWAEQLGADPGARVQPIVAPYPGGGVILFGGYTPTTYTNLTDTWRWNAGTWTQLTPANQPPYLSGAVHDRQRDRIVGAQGGATWEWNGTNWVQRALPTVPSVRSPRGAYLAATGRTVMPVNGNTWEWDGLAWERRIVSGPPARDETQLVGMGDRVLMFGGRFPTSADTWSYDGMLWTDHTATPAPPGRSRAGLAYDRARDRVVLFGGMGAMPFGDTWEWNGSTWSELTPTTSPAPRWDVQLTYDEVHATTLLVGGRTATGTVLDEVWAWDGSTWTDRTPADMPPTSGSRLIWNPHRGMVTLLVDRGYSRPYEIWEWDGTRWVYLSITNPLPNTNGWGLGLLAFDAARTELFAFGDSQGGTKGHVLRFERLSVPSEACIETDTDGDSLAGCADPDCWGRCTPMCGPSGFCAPDGPRCGDGTCSPLEDPHLCPADC